MQSDQLVSFMVVVSPHGEKSSPYGLGRRGFRIAPRTGEYVEVPDENEKAHLYKVKAVLHPFTPVENAGDLLLEYLGPTGDVLAKLHG